MNRRQRAVTLEDVARESGYSRATVSRVVNGSPNVDPLIAAEIGRAIKKTGYSVNRAARALAGGASHTIGLVFMESFLELLQNPYWAHIVEGVSTLLWDAEYQEAFLVRDSMRRSRIDSYLAQRSVDGVIFMSAPDNDEMAAELADRGIPVVVFGTPPDPTRIPSVRVDEERVGRIAAQHLVAKGRRRPVVITGRPDMQVSNQRASAFRLAMGDAGIRFDNDRSAQGGFTVEGGQAAMEELLRRDPRLDAVFACSDRMAIGALAALHEAGRKVPDDVAVVGVDGTSLGELTRPRLTSIGSDHRAIGEALAELMLGALKGVAPHQVLYPAQLIERESS